MLGNFERQRLDVDLRGAAGRSTPPSRTPGASSPPTRCTLTGRRATHIERHLLVQVDVGDVSAHLVDLVLLENRGVRLADAVDLDVEDRMETGSAGEGAPRAPARRRKGWRRATAAGPRTPGNDPRAAQPARLARPSCPRRRRRRAFVRSPAISAAHSSEQPAPACNIRTCSRTCCRPGTAKGGHPLRRRQRGVDVRRCIDSTALGLRAGAARGCACPPGRRWPALPTASASATASCAAADYPRGRAGGARGSRAPEPGMRADGYCFATATSSLRSAAHIAPPAT